MKNKPAPLLNPATLKPMTAEELGHVFCDELVQQELDDTDPYIDIPREILDFYRMYRPSPLTRAYCLEKSSRLRQRFTINLRVITQAEAISLILQSHRHIMQRNKA